MKIYPKLNERRISINEAREGLYAGGEWVQINVSNARSSRATACHKQQWRPKSIQLNNAEPSLFECGYLRNKKRNISYRNSFEKSKKFGRQNYSSTSHEAVTSLGFDFVCSFLTLWKTSNPS